MATNMKWTAAAACGAVTLAMLTLSGCQKEATEPSFGNEEIAILNDAPKSFGGTVVYALTTTGGVSNLVRVNTTSRVYSAPRAIVASLAPVVNVNHFKGIAWDPVGNCTWLVTDNTASIPAHRNRLWRIPGPLPTSPGGALLAVPGPLLTEAIGGALVTNAMDIERDPVTGNIYLLRQGGQFAILNTVGTSAGQVANLPMMGINAQAFTFSCNGRLMALKCVFGGATTSEMDKVTGGLILGTTIPFSTAGFLASPDAGMEPAPGNCDLYAVNAFVTPLGMGSTNSPFYSTHASLASTLDMTSM